MSGADEGIDEWLTVNYLLDNFKSPQQTLGLIRLGGSSTQIAFLSKSKTIFFLVLLLEYKFSCTRVDDYSGIQKIFFKFFHLSHPFFAFSRLLEYSSSRKCVHSSKKYSSTRVRRVFLTTLIFLFKWF